VSESGIEFDTQEDFEETPTTRDFSFLFEKKIPSETPRARRSGSLPMDKIIQE